MWILPSTTLIEKQVEKQNNNLPREITRENKLIRP